MVLGLSFLPGLDMFEVVLFLVEYLPYIVAANVVLAVVAKKGFKIWVICAFPLFMTAAVIITIINSYEHAARDGYDLTKPSLREALEQYIETGEGNAADIIENNEYPPVFGKYEIQYLINDLFKQTFLHTDSMNEENIPLTYNLGNDWYSAFLGEAMTYTSGIFKNGDETLLQAQHYKIDHVAHAIDLKKGEKVLDIGCGWGPAVERFSVKYGATVTGVTLSQEQINFFEKNKRPKLPKGSKSKMILQDGNKLLENKEIASTKFDKIISLEMMEHVGIRRYDEFLQVVKGLLKDDGVFYMQVAGLKRDWRYMDFVWGLFMGEHIFPGADASVPIGWVTTHLERNGFEVQRVNNLGSHYSRTIDLWLEEWMKNEDEMVKAYGEKKFRRWIVFLRWSVRIAREGGSTVFMITNTKQNVEKTRIETQQRLVPIW